MMETYNKEDVLHKIWLYRILEAIADNAYLSSVLYFKGGTCASMLGWLDRFSVDLDFDYAGEISDIGKVRDNLEKIFNEYGLSIKDKSKSGIQYFLKYESSTRHNKNDATSRIGRNTIKIDVSFPLYKASRYAPMNFIDIDRILICQTIETMFAHKLCAVMDRFEKTGHIAGRDLYDIHHFFLQGYEYSSQVIIDRTNLQASDFFTKLYNFIEVNVNEKIITEDLSPLISKENFKILRKVLKREILSFLKTEIDKF